MDLYLEMLHLTLAQPMMKLTQSRDIMTLQSLVPKIVASIIGWETTDDMQRTVEVFTPIKHQFQLPKCVPSHNLLEDGIQVSYQADSWILGTRFYWHVNALEKDASECGYFYETEFSGDNWENGKWIHKKWKLTICCVKLIMYFIIHTRSWSTKAKMKISWTLKTNFYVFYIDTRGFECVVYKLYLDKEGDVVTKRLQSKEQGCRFLVCQQPDLPREVLSQSNPKSTIGFFRKVNTKLAWIYDKLIEDLRYNI